MNRKDPSFRDLTGAVQVRYRELHTAGVGAVVKACTRHNTRGRKSALGIERYWSAHSPRSFTCHFLLCWQNLLWGRSRENLQFNVPTILIVTRGEWVEESFWGQF